MVSIASECLLSSVALSVKEKKPLRVVYQNWRGEKAVRDIVPETLFFGSTEWHPEEQWFLRAFDLNREVYRDFALKDMLVCSESNSVH